MRRQMMEVDGLFLNPHESAAICAIRAAISCKLRDFCK
jgi:hypothetical protein